MLMMHLFFPCVQKKLSFQSPGSTPDFDGLISITNNSHLAFPDFKMTAKDEIVDEKQSRIVLFLNVAGTQAGHVPLNVSDCSEWLGIPGTGKRTDVRGLCTQRYLLCTTF
jgi:hypothetical protein